MPINIQLPESEIGVLTEVYAAKLKIIREQRALLDEQERAIENIISQLHKKPAKEEIEATLPIPFKVTLGPYDSKSTIVGKIAYILQESGKEMSSAEVVARQLILEPALNADKAKAAKNVSSILSMNIGEGKPFKRRKDEERKEFIYSLS